eukprot:Seg201.4 transcript_id=Seg201.4/GoldUCD/mRNA.D3Y31 product="hypothetical protein" protein_id=Seg201.4/GoldUCD/D3Y31
MLFDLIQQSTEESNSILKDRTVYFSNKREYTMITEAQATVAPELACAASISKGDSVMIRSPSGDIDIPTLFVTHNFGNKKGKCACWKALLKRREFVEVFGKLGIENEVTQSLLEELETFVCCLYGFPRLSNVNDVRKAMFWEKFEKKKKINVSELLLDDDGSIINADDEDDDNGQAAFGDDLDDDLENISDFE